MQRSGPAGWWARPAIIVLVLLVVLPGVALAQSPQLEQGLDEVERERQRAEEDLDTAREREGDARQRLAAVESELATIEADLGELEQRHAAAVATEEHARAAATSAREQLAEVLEELATTEDALDVAVVKLEGRVRAAFKYGQVSFLEAFTQTADIAEFLNSGTYLARVLEVDRELVAEVSDLLAAVELQRAEAQGLREDAEREAAVATEAAAEVADALAEQQRLAEQLEQRRSERAGVYEELREDRAAIEDHLDALAAESSRIESQLAEIARQQAAEQARLEEERRLAEQRGATGGSDAAPAPGEVGAWLRPTSGSLSSPFGPRWGRNHNGIDIAAPIGTRVIASAPGTVVHVTNGCHATSSWGCGGGFGNYAIVSHAGGMATVYAHLSSLAVGVGQPIGAGESLGAVGNSGSSYGAHLHFEIREAGIARDPCGYLPC